MTRVLAVLWLALIALAAPAAAQTFPPLTGRVVDNAHLLRPEQVLDLTSKSQALETQTGRQFVIATVPSLEGRPIEDYGYRLGRAWAIGQKGKDDGVILLVAPNERKVRIETGYGARVFLTDAVSSVIVREAILPRFKAGDYGGGIEAGADEIIKQMSLTPEEAQRTVAKAERAQQARKDASPGIIPVIFWMLVIVFVIIPLVRRMVGGRRYRTRRGGISPWIILWGLDELSRGSRRGGWGGSSSGWGGGSSGWSSGGGGFSGGGGSFGGGGASGSW
ncbi:MAG: TPM domain-containing protein [Sphingomicrobium sp.]